MTLPVVLHGHETSSSTLQLEQTGSNRVLRILGPKRDNVAGGWRKLHNEELHELCSSQSIVRKMGSRRMRWEVYVARTGLRRMQIGY
jgi:hypothetical protein